MHEVLRTLSEIGIIPVVALEDAADAAPLAKALCAGGIPTAEVTFRTGAAAASIAAIRQNVPEMLVGAGTVLTVENAEAAVAAGADGLMIEVHNDPKNALCDGAQSLTPSQFQQVMAAIAPYLALEGKSLSTEAPQA